MKKQSYKAVVNLNVFEKQQFYVKLETEGEEPIFIQIGEKNYEKIKQQSEQPKPNGANIL